MLGANLGRALVAVLSVARADIATRRLPMGTLILKGAACALAAPFMGLFHVWLQEGVPQVLQQIVVFNLMFNLAQALLFVPVVKPLAQALERWMAPPPQVDERTPRHLDQLALDTPSLALSCAAREALRQADAVETMLRGIVPVIRGNDLGACQGSCRVSHAATWLISSSPCRRCQSHDPARVERHDANGLPVARMARPAIRVRLTSLGVQCVPRCEDLVGPRRHGAVLG